MLYRKKKLRRRRLQICLLPTIVGGRGSAATRPQALDVAGEDPDWHWSKFSSFNHI